MDKTSLGDRQKRYEKVQQTYLTRRVPVIIRCDGNCFSTWTKGLERPFDENFRQCMEYATYKLCKDMSGARLGYTQSDEITIVLVDYQTFNTEPWFDYRRDKVLTMAATICSSAFNWACLKYLPEHVKRHGFARFDARAFNVPQDDVVNNFLWRQRDCEKNSVQSVAHANFSDKQLHKKNGNEMQDMLMLEKGINWNDFPTKYKRGMSVWKASESIKDTYNEGKWVTRSHWYKDYAMPIISKRPDYVDSKIEAEINYPPVGAGIPSENICEDLNAEDVFKV